jgi:YHS domain-containing protein
MRHIGLLTLLTATLFLMQVPHSAGAGYFYESGGAALRGYDPVAYFTAGRPVRGSSAHAADYKGSRFLFASPENREAFLAHPERYAPQYGGFCAYGVASGYKAAIDPAAFSVVDDKLYLNYSPRIHQRWRADVRGYVRRADHNWPRVATQSKIVE